MKRPKTTLRLRYSTGRKSEFLVNWYLKGQFKKYNQDEATAICAYLLGYRINTEGRLLSPKGSAIPKRVELSSLYPAGVYRANISVLKKEHKLYFYKLAAFQKYFYRAFDARFTLKFRDGNSLNNSCYNMILILAK